MNVEALRQYVRAADYIAAIQIYLTDNCLLHDSLAAEDIKERLLGHWGTCPGINFIYAHLNRAIVEHDLDMMCIIGPGHGFPALQANLFIEGTLSQYDPKVPRNAEGLAHIAKQFSWPHGYPSHSNPEAPGVVLEGGELGYALSTAFGTVLDNPSLITACIVGDGEAETGPTAAAWHASKLLDPVSNGAVLPIVHINGYKISGPTVYGRMSDEDLTSLFKGYGYEPIIVDTYACENDGHVEMMEALNKAVESIRFTQHCAREGSLTEPPRWPVILLRSPKGWHSIDLLDGKKITDNHYSHQVIAEHARTNEEHRSALEEWLRSYRFNELFDGSEFNDSIKSITPRPERAMGNNRRAFGGDPYYQPLQLPAVEEYGANGTCRIDDPSCQEASSMEEVGRFFAEVMKSNIVTGNLRLFSPDETYSNKMDAVFETTSRAWMWPQKEWDKHMAPGGRVLEMLSEHTLQGMLQGYLLTGRHGVFVTYEAFAQVVASMADQYAKFLAVAREVPWRGDVPSLNYILTSSGWRQEHNGFSHQNPGFIDGVLQRQGCFSNVYLPADANTALVAFSHMLESKNEINVLVSGKRPLPLWRTVAEARQDIQDGIAIWDFASDDDPHVVLASCGDYVTKEALAAVTLLHRLVPELRVRYVNISTLSALGVGCRILREDLSHYFTNDKPVRISFHGYPQTLKQVLFDYGYSKKRVHVYGYQEQGSTTTPFDMMVRNGVDRYSLVISAVEAVAAQGVLDAERARFVSVTCKKYLADHRNYIITHGDDPEDIKTWSWHPRSS